MRRTLLHLAVLGIAATSYAQEGDPAGSPPPVANLSQVSLLAKGDDVRSVLCTLFAQAKKDFVLEPNIHFALFLSLTNMEFEEALQIVCKTAELKYEVQNGIFFISRKKPVIVPKTTAPAEIVAPEPKGKLPADVLKKTLTTRLTKTDLRAVFGEIQKQTGVTIEVEGAVPRYKVDAFLIATSLKYALDVLTKATGCKYSFTDRKTILISADKEVNRVSIVDN